MAKLEGFRLVNIHANHNSIIYPNEYFDIAGKNALIDMKNGGGKTLAAQMLFQTILPNSCFTDKNPIINLFSGVSNGSTIHCVSHFSLECQEFNDLCLGFAAIAEPKNNDEMADVTDKVDLGLKFMNYIIVGNNLAADTLSIDTLPLSKNDGNEIHPLNYKELKEFLQSKMRNDKHGRYYFIQFFENEKTKYYQELKKFGINSEVFEFLREINKDENYIKQFFEEKCKRPRDLLMNFIIPNTEKALDARAFTMKLEKVDRSSQLAESLFEKSLSLNELNKFEADKSEYEKLKDEIGAFIEFVRTREEALANFDLHLQEYPKQVAAHMIAVRNGEEKVRGLDVQRLEWVSQQEQIQMDLDNIEIRELQIKLEVLQNTFDEKENTLKRINNEIKDLNHQKIKMEAINLSIDYKRSEAEKISIDEMLEKLTNANYDEKKTTSELANTVCKLASEAISGLEEQCKCQDTKLNDEKVKNADINKKAGQLEEQLKQNSKNNVVCEEEKNNIIASLTNVEKELRNYPIFSGLMIDTEELKEIERLQFKIADDLDATRKYIDDIKEKKYRIENEIDKTGLTLKERLKELEEKNQWLNEFKSSLEVVKSKTGAEEDNMEDTCDHMEQQGEAHVKNITELQRKITEIEEEISILEDYGFLRSKSKYDAFNALRVDWQYAQFGSDILKTLDRTKVDAILDRFPGFSEVLVVTDEDYQRVANGKKTVNVAIAKENFILMPWSAINRIDKDFKFDELFMMTRDGEYYRGLLDSKKAIEMRNKEAGKIKDTCTRLEQEKDVISSQVKLLKQHLYQYPNHLTKKYNEDASRINDQIKTLKAVGLQLTQQLKSIELREEEFKSSIVKLLDNKDQLDKKSVILLEKINMGTKLNGIDIQLIKLGNERKQLEQSLENNKAELKVSLKELETIGQAIQRLEQNIRQYQKYLDMAKGYKDKQFDILNEEDITSLFKRFEAAKSQFDEKVQNYDNLVQQEKKLNNQMEEIKKDHKFKQFPFNEIYRLDYIEKIRASEIEAIDNKLLEMEKVKPDYENAKNNAAAELIDGQKQYDKVKQKITVYFSKFQELNLEELNALKELNKAEFSKIVAWLNKNNELLQKIISENNNFKNEMGKFTVFCETNSLVWKNATQAADVITYEVMYRSYEKLKAEYDKALNKINQEIRKIENNLKSLSINEQVKGKLKDQLLPKRFYSEVSQLVRLLEQTSVSISLTIKNLETSIENIGRLDEEIASQVYRMLKTILDEVSKIPEYSKFKYEDYSRESFRINLTEENSCRIDNDIALSRIKAHIYDLAHSVQNEGMTKKEIKNKLCISSIIHFGIDFDKLNIQILKIEQDKPKYYTWGRLSASSGQSYVTYVMFAITMIKYFNNVTLISEKMKAPILVFLDNPFASASAIELWEPVRRFLDKSNAQLLCVAHNVPSSAQILFDKHMIIEQTKNSKGQFINTMRNEKTESKEIIQMNLFEHLEIE